jgi:hypothetical protein
MIDESYIRTSERAIQDIMYDTLYNMSLLLEDNLGKIPDREARLVIRNLVVSPTGTLQGLGESLPLDNDILLGQEQFNPFLSKYAQEVHSSLMTPNSEYVFKANYTPDIELNMIHRHTRGLPDFALSYMSYLYLELYSVFTSVVDYKAGEVLRMTVSELDIIMSNSRYISAKIGTIGNQENTYGLLNVLKHIQRAILFVKQGILLILR